MSFLTKKGEQIAQLELSKRILYADKLINGDPISNYNTGVCHDVVAFTLYMRGAKISYSELKSISGQEWLRKFNYLQGNLWNGYSPILPGKAIGFYRKRDNTFFHSAVSTNNLSFIRSVNGYKLGSGWADAVNMKFELGKRKVVKNKDGNIIDIIFIYDNIEINVYISDL